MKVVGVVRRFNLVDKFIVLGRSDEPKDEQYFATTDIFVGMLRETDLANFTEFEVEVDGKIITSFHRLGDLTRAEFRDKVVKASTARRMEGVA